MVEAQQDEGRSSGSRFSTNLENWREVVRAQNLPEGRTADPVSRWLLIVRASVFPMTVISAAIGGLLVVAGPDPVTPNWLFFAEALVGLVIAHAANNMINDYFDLASGLDSEDYVRGQYAPHPILSGLISKRGLLAAIAVANLLDLVILVHLTSARGWPVIVFALAGLFVSVFYVVPPLRLKQRGLGEPGVALVWGPLMIGGTYFVTAGEMPAWVLAASLPYAILVTAVLFGKHLDKLAADQEKGIRIDKLAADEEKEIRTLPVMLGDARSRFMTQWLIGSFFALVAMLVLTGSLGVWTLAVFVALPRAVKVIRVFGEPKPETPPENVPIWPLWYVAWAFILTRLAGLLFLAGLLANAIYPVFL
jgi:1,4-dihydroxy-2-naphthoate octaprenyltransferase